MSHTPGPWEVYGPVDLDYWIIYRYPNGYDQHVATAHWNRPEDYSVVLNDAHIIAAAPEMYIALQNVRVELDSYPHCPFCGSVHGEGHEKDCIGYEVEAAIRKARGEE